MTTALKAAFALHQPFALDKPLASASGAELDEWRRRNSARSSLLNDSWPHKNQAFRQLMSAPCLPTPHTPMSDERIQQHHAIIQEEWNEFWQAIMSDNLIETLDGGMDLIYTILDFLIARGFHPAALNAAYEEIHASNMTKVDANGRPVIINGKVQKTPHHHRPNLHQALASATPSFDLSPPVPSAPSE